MKKALFIDRDGVLNKEVLPFLTRKEELTLIKNVPQVLSLLKKLELELIVITNQPVIARGIITESELEDIHAHLNKLITSQGGPQINHFYFCPHHPKADLEKYKIDCSCRKPKPGLILRACSEMSINPQLSFMIGDRQSDIAAGHRAGCKTILLKTGAHLAKPIESNDHDLSITADFECSDWITASRYIEKMVGDSR